MEAGLDEKNLRRTQLTLSSFLKTKDFGIMTQILATEDRLKKIFEKAFTILPFEQSVAIINQELSHSAGSRFTPNLMRMPVSRNYIKSFSQHYGDKIEQGFEPDSFNRLFRIYSNSAWRNNDVFNGFIRGFGSNFDNFKPRQLVQFTESLAIVGLAQEDIFRSVIEKVVSEKSGHFGPTHGLLLTQLMQLSMHESANYAALVNSCQECYGHPIEHLVKDMHFTDQIELLYATLATGSEASQSWVSCIV